jgi:hypothetical protein
MLYINTPKFRLAGLTVFICLYLFAACDDGLAPPSGGGASNPQYPSPPDNLNLVTGISFSSTTPYSPAVQRVENNGSPKTITLSGLNNHDVFVVMVNTSDSNVNANNTGYVVSYNSENTFPGTGSVIDARKSESSADGLTGPVSGVFTGADGRTIVRYENNEKNEEVMDAIRKGKLRPPANAAASQGAAVSQDGNGILRSAGYTALSYTVGSTKTFWVQKSNAFIQIPATLRATGTHSNVWVANVNYASTSSSDVDNKITTAQAGSLSTNFDKIYEMETPVFGYEYGGGITDTSDEDYGGVDRDTKIQILVYDIDGDYESTQTGGVLGQFIMLDEFPQDVVDSAGLGYNKTNEAEIFYVDAHFTDLAPDMMYSTLAHEFQHMINFNVKTIKSATSDQLPLSGVWYNEMLSMLAEDLIDPLIDIGIDNGGHPFNVRIPDFLENYYFDDLTVWHGNLESYANAYAFGAYLVRNFGGVDFIQKVMSDTQLDTASLDAALASDVNPLKDSGVNSFNTALARYGEVMLFNQTSDSRPSGVLSFNNTVTKKIGSTDYTFSGFDIWSKPWQTSTRKTFYGPCVYNTDTKYSLKPRTMLLQSNSKWQNVTDSLKITIQPPSASGVELYVMVR